MIEKWETSRWTDGINRLECTRETDSSVWVHEPSRFGEKTERKRMKKSGGTIIHDTWEDAYAHLVERAKRNLEYAQEYLIEAKNTYDKLMELRKP